MRLQTQNNKNQESIIFFKKAKLQRANHSRTSGWKSTSYMCAWDLITRHIPHALIGRQMTYCHPPKHDWGSGISVEGHVTALLQRLGVLENTTVH